MALKEKMLDLFDALPLFKRVRRAIGIVRFRGVFRAECRDKNGKLKWIKEFANGTTTGGFNHIYNVMFGATAKSASWYLGLISNVGFTGFAATDTMASHPGWGENVGYTQGTRVQYIPGAAAAGSIVNPAVSAFNINVNTILIGFFLSNDNVKSGTTGILWATASWGGNQNVAPADVINVTYTITNT